MLLKSVGEKRGISNAAISSSLSDRRSIDAIDAETTYLNPASITATVTFGFSLSLAAITFPAVPANNGVG